MKQMLEMSHKRWWRWLGIGSYVALQDVEHALLCNLFALVKLLQCLFDLVVLNLALTLLLVVEVQAAALHLL